MKKYKISMLTFISITDAENEVVLHSFRATNTVIVEPEQFNLATSSLLNSLDVAKKSVEEMGGICNGNKQHGC